MSKRSILFIRLRPLADRVEETRLRDRIMAETGEGTLVTVLTTTPAKGAFSGMEVTLWVDGAPKGLLRLLELMRRLSWAQFSAIYDVDGGFRVKAYKWLVRPRPPWHRDASFAVRADKAA
ncbi:MAG: hypothetical protein RLN89_13110 [Parvibaculum sp.]